MIDYLGVVAVIFFYLLILIVGVWAGRKAKNADAMSIDGEQTEEIMLAGRNIGTLVGIFTMTGKYLIFGLNFIYTFKKLKSTITISIHPFLFTLHRSYTSNK